MGNSPPDNVFERIRHNLVIYGFALPLFFAIRAYDTVVSWIKGIFQPKHKNLNWLRKLAGIPLK